MQVIIYNIYSVQINKIYTQMKEILLRIDLLSLFVKNSKIKRI